MDRTSTEAAANASELEMRRVYRFHVFALSGMFSGDAPNGWLMTDKFDGLLGCEGNASFKTT